MAKKFNVLLAVFLVISLLLPAVQPVGTVSAQAPLSFTILHTNDFHGQLESSGSNPGIARVATVINDVTAQVGPDKVLLVDDGDLMQGSLLSNLQKGKPSIAVFNALGYDVGTFGNHEFDWGQDVLAERMAEANYPYVTANIMKAVNGSCATYSWEKPDFADAPYTVLTVNGVRVAFVGVTSIETPIITVASATAGLCFQDPLTSILHYYDEIKANSDVIVVQSHLGFNDGGYGYGIPVIGDKTLAQKLIDAGKPVHLIIGGHSHTDLAAATTVGNTLVAQAHYNGRKVGRADFTFDPTTKAVTVSWTRLVVNPASANPPTPEDAAIKALVQSYANEPDYLTKKNTPIGYTNVDLARNGGRVDNMMGTFVDDAIYHYLNTDTDPVNDIDIFFNNSGGIRTDWCAAPKANTDPVEWVWSGTGCKDGLYSNHTPAHGPMLLTYGEMFTILPFGNATVVGTMTGAQVLEILNQSPVAISFAQPAGIKFKYYSYRDSEPGPQPYAWGAFAPMVLDKATGEYVPLDLNKTYRVGTNEFLAPAGQDGLTAFKYMKNVSYWGDMLDAVNAYVLDTYTYDHPYQGPNDDGTLDGRITRIGTDAGGEVIPVTILHHNDSHGRLIPNSSTPGYTQLATLIKQERRHNPSRTLLLTSGDNLQGDLMSFYYKDAGLGKAADGSTLPDDLQISPFVKMMRAMGYDAMTLGNHEFNFGPATFGTLVQATEPSKGPDDQPVALLQANIYDTGEYGLDTVGVQPYIEKTLGPENIKVAILGIGNHRVPQYELPSNIPGLTFSNPIEKGMEFGPDLDATNDVVVALTHIGFTTDPKSVEVDANVDTAFAAQVPGIDVVIGGHSHTNPSSGQDPYKYLPSVIAGPENTPVLVGQAYRYNTMLGQMVIGLMKVGDRYEVVSSAGRFISVNTLNSTSATPEDPDIKALLKPFADQLSAYNATAIGTTTVPIDTMKAFTEETNGANLQADASVWKLTQAGKEVDVHLSGAMTNRKIADTATVDTPYNLSITDMFNAMPYENSLLVLSMNGPQLKTVLERAYRNYYFYKYVPGYGGYSYYTTCMLDTNSVGRIFYQDTYPAMPNGDNVVGLLIDGKPVNFEDASTYYRVSTVNYLAAGSCNFNDGGKSLWPLDQIVADTQYYVRDAVIEYVTAMGSVAPKVEGRLLFADTVAPVITIDAPQAQPYLKSDTLGFEVVDPTDGTKPDRMPGSGVQSVMALLDGVELTSAQAVDLFTLPVGKHTLLVSATDFYGNTSSTTLEFELIASVGSLKAMVNEFYARGWITNAGVRDSLLDKLNTAEAQLTAGKTKQAVSALNAFLNQVKAQYGKHISPAAADLLSADALWVIANPK